VGLLPTIVSLM